MTKTKTPDILSAIDNVVATTFALRDSRTAAAVERLFQAGVAHETDGSALCPDLWPASEHLTLYWIATRERVNGLMPHPDDPNLNMIRGAAWGPLEGLAVRKDEQPYCDCEVCEGPDEYPRTYVEGLTMTDTVYELSDGDVNVLFYPPDGVEPSVEDAQMLRKIFYSAQRSSWSRACHALALAWHGPRMSDADIVRHRTWLSQWLFEVTGSTRIQEGAVMANIDALDEAYA